VETVGKAKRNDGRKELSRKNSLNKSKKRSISPAKKVFRIEVGGKKQKNWKTTRRGINYILPKQQKERNF